MFKLVNSETKPLTPELAERFKAMQPSPTERVFDPTRARMLREKAEAGQLIAFSWAIAKMGDKEYRVNGQHSSAVLTELNGHFPQGLKVHLDTYEVDSPDGAGVWLVDTKSGSVELCMQTANGAACGPMPKSVKYFKAAPGWEDPLADIIADATAKLKPAVPSDAVAPPKQ